jgi:putative RNA 2'-phosphotransferase
MDLIATSKRRSYLLRHNPGAAGLTLDPAGWVEVQDLLGALEQAGTPLTRAELDRVVALRRMRSDAQVARISGNRESMERVHAVPVMLRASPKRWQPHARGDLRDAGV